MGFAQNHDGRKIRVYGKKMSEGGFLILGATIGSKVLPDALEQPLFRRMAGEKVMEIGSIIDFLYASPLAVCFKPEKSFL